MKGTILRIQNADGTWRDIASVEAMTIKGERSMVVTGNLEITKVDWVELMKLRAMLADQK